MWWSGHAVGFDLETDGRDPVDARIITSAVVQLIPWQAVATFEWMAKPERPIPDEATGIHGISTARATEEGAEREVVVRAIVEQLSAAGAHWPVVGHNLSYDLTVLDREMRRLGLGHLVVLPGGGMVQIIAEPDPSEPFSVVDTYVLDKAVDTYRRGSRKLADVAQHYGVPMAEGSAHGAAADVVAAIRIALTIAKRARDARGGPGYDRMMSLYRDRRDPEGVVVAFAQVGGLSMPELHAQQARWAAAQAEGLRDYFLRKGDVEAAESVSGAWPVRTLQAEHEPVKTVDTTVL